MNNIDSTFSCIFGTPVACIKVKENTDILQSCHKHIGDGKWNRTYENLSQNTGWVYNGEGDMRILESYPQIKKVLLDAFLSFASEVMMLKNVNFDITTSWLTKMEKGDSSPLHLHANSFWSGVYYYGEEYEQASPIEFEHPLINHIKDYGFYIQPDGMNEYNTLKTGMYPQKNQLILFPSYLKHRICEHKSDKTRYSLAFNIVPIGGYGYGDSQYNTEWFN